MSGSENPPPPYEAVSSSSDGRNDQDGQDLSRIDPREAVLCGLGHNHISVERYLILKVEKNLKREVDRLENLLSSSRDESRANYTQGEAVLRVLSKHVDETRGNYTRQLSCLITTGLTTIILLLSILIIVYNLSDVALQNHHSIGALWAWRRGYSSYRIPDIGPDTGSGSNITVTNDHDNLTWDYKD